MPQKLARSVSRTDARTVHPWSTSVRMVVVVITTSAHGIGRVSPSGSYVTYTGRPLNSA